MNYLLTSDEDGNEHVNQYSDGELRELFSDHQIQELKDGCAVVVEHRHGALRYVDMIIAARFIR